MSHCNCCIPECPTPTIIYEQKTARGHFCWFYNGVDLDLKHLRLKQEWDVVRGISQAPEIIGSSTRELFYSNLDDDGNVRIDCSNRQFNIFGHWETADGQYTASWDTDIDAGVINWTTTQPNDDGIPFTSTGQRSSSSRFLPPTLISVRAENEVETFLEPFNINEFAQRVVQHLEAEEWVAATSFRATFFHDEADFTPNVDLVTIRIRFRIPSDFDPPPLPALQKWHGEYQRIEFDLITEYQADIPDLVTRESIIWTGPADLPGEDESWLTDWVEIPAPMLAGTTRVELVRSQCYRGGPWLYH